jgi:hypothetical protein
MAAAEFPLLIFLVASSLSCLLNFHLVVGELRRSLRARGYGRSQKVHPRSSGLGRGVNDAASFYSKRFASCHIHCRIAAVSAVPTMSPA